jgi:hypothetical protein
VPPLFPPLERRSCEGRSARHATARTPRARRGVGVPAPVLPAVGSLGCATDVQDAPPTDCARRIHGQPLRPVCQHGRGCHEAVPHQRRLRRYFCCAYLGGCCMRGFLGAGPRWFKGWVGALAIARERQGLTSCAPNAHRGIQTMPRAMLRRNSLSTLSPATPPRTLCKFARYRWCRQAGFVACHGGTMRGGFLANRRMEKQRKEYKVMCGGFVPTEAGAVEEPACRKGDREGEKGSSVLGSKQNVGMHCASGNVGMHCASGMRPGDAAWCRVSCRLLVEPMVSDCAGTTCRSGT